MEDFFLEFQFNYGASDYWFPMMVTKKTLQEAVNINESVKIGLENQFQNVTTKDPMIYKKGLSSNYIDDYIKNNFRGKIQSITINEWKITQLDFERSIDFENLKSKIVGDYPYTISNVEEKIFSIVRLPDWPPVDYVEAFVINVYE